MLLLAGVVAAAGIPETGGVDISGFAGEVMVNVNDSPACAGVKLVLDREMEVGAFSEGVGITIVWLFSLPHANTSGKNAEKRRSFLIVPKDSFFRSYLQCPAFFWDINYGNCHSKFPFPAPTSK
jgi:hypothetical protein